jgi:hypothetical protein
MLGGIGTKNLFAVGASVVAVIPFQGKATDPQLVAYPHFGYGR